MNKTIIAGALLAGLLAGATASAECTYPRAPSNLPDGATATQDDMLKGMKDIKEYNAQVTSYLECLETEMNTRIQSAGADAPRSFSSSASGHSGRVGPPFRFSDAAARL